ncbi:beta family protein [Porphyrobacter sp. CACIAM 03H1]|uniref:beta family protein n=1 Tax=Porphyrobacter sp. CACIAM 03H1 TaxID=2003315 RepID=UPI000B5A92E8|nr:hypothetical protein [Porphyrobacter sp. CACIAM 03H1]ASJ91608.1 hypothetical protein CBR61_12240 [Porphyrobacter sp. CACIAM 03H1]
MLKGREYVPLLYTRLAEIRAMRELPESSKNLMVPVFKLRPWLNSKELDRAVEVVEEAVGNRLYGLDLDEFKLNLNPDPSKTAATQFLQLFEKAEGYKNYYDLVASGPNRVPVFRGINDADLEIEKQIEHILHIDRGVFVRAKVGEPGSLLEIARKLAENDIDNAVFIIDCGWGRDLLVSAALASQFAQRLVNTSDKFEIVIAGSSFPDDFKGLGERFTIPAIERQLYFEVRRQVNFDALYYGDWGSTRPPTDPIPMKHVPRIDTARSTDWVCWRSEDDETYVEVAQRVITDPAWDGKLGIWGEYMVVATAEEEAVRIKAPAMAAAVRVNIHLHQQANFDNPGGLHVGDEAVGDDL